MVAGFSRSRNAGPEGFEAFPWTRANGLKPLGFILGEPYRSSLGNGISPDGSVVVGQGMSARGLEGFRWEADRMIGVGALPGGEYVSYTTAASAAGRVLVGQSGSDQGHEAFRWVGGELFKLGTLKPEGRQRSAAYDITPDAAVIVAQAVSPLGYEAFRWQDGQMVGLGDLPGGDYLSEASSVTPDGRVILGRGAIAGGSVACRWQGNPVEALGDLPGRRLGSWALDVSAGGAIIVGQGSDECGSAAFVWERRHGLRRLQDVLERDFNLDLRGMQLIKAEAISDDGRTLSGTGWNALGQLEPWVAHIPTLFALGDLRCDRNVDFGDVNPFVLALGDPDEHRRRYPDCEIMNADCNRDGNLDFGDINPFVELLSKRDQYRCNESEARARSRGLRSGDSCNRVRAFNPEEAPRIAAFAPHSGPRSGGPTSAAARARGDHHGPLRGVQPDGLHSRMERLENPCPPEGDDREGVGAQVFLCSACPSTRGRGLCSVLVRSPLGGRHPHFPVRTVAQPARS